MANVATVALIGRPNTGKSTLFNRISGSRSAIESHIPGTTRDHIAETVEHDQFRFLLVDTGGIGGGSEDADLEDDVSKQTLLAIESADVIVLTINGREPLTAGDEQVVSILRKSRRKHVPVIIAVTKCDNDAIAEDASANLESLGVSDAIVPLSATQNTGVGELLDAIETQLLALHFSPKEEVDEESETPKIALVGIPNVGKSSLMNALLSDGQKKSSMRIVSDIPGTTRDSASVPIMYDEKKYIFVDTAGIKRKSRTEELIGYYSYLRSMQAITDADITILMLDPHSPLSRQEKRIASMAVEEGKGLILLVSKSDTMTKEQREEKKIEIQTVLTFCKDMPILFTSAESRKDLVKMFPMIDKVYQNRQRRIPTKRLHEWYAQVAQRLPSKGISQVKHLTQAESSPPTFVLFVKNPKNIQTSELRYLEKSLRMQFGFEGTPIRFITKSNTSKD